VVTTAAINFCCYYIYYNIINSVLGDSGTNLEKIIRWRAEEGISRKEKEGNEGEVTSAINYSGTVTYMKLLYKETYMDVTVRRIGY
jgi:hypothetical protein